MKAKEYNSILPRNIRNIINASGLKQYIIAERAGFSKQQFNDMVNGRRIIKPCDVVAIASALNVEVSDLFAIKKEGD